MVAPELLEELRAADILMVNNEFPFSDRGTADGGQTVYIPVQSGLCKGIK